MLERDFQQALIKELEAKFEGCVIMKNDANYRQGFPDLVIFWHDRWATLEVKKSATASRQPNQDFWVQRLNAMSFSRFIFPENKDTVLHDLRRFFYRLP